MDAVLHMHKRVGPQPLFIEAGTGLGKTLGYLLPYAYVATAEHKLVVATSTLVLQNQLIQTAIPTLAAVLGRDLPAVEVKVRNIILISNKFAASLHQESPSRQTQLLQMKLLVWLTQTTTGDLDELRQQLIGHHCSCKFGILVIQAHHLSTRITRSFIGGCVLPLIGRLSWLRITLFCHATLICWTGAPFLVVDEAQHFADNTAAAFAQRIDLAQIRRQLRHLWRLVIPMKIAHWLTSIKMIGRCCLCWRNLTL